MRDNDGTCTQQEVCKFLANLMDVLEKQMSDSENPNKWIPVSERFPEENGRYLVTRGLNACGDNCEAEIWAKQKKQKESDNNDD